jgi:hypothetical protein
MTPSTDPRKTTLILDENELLMINNALNEVRNGIDVDDFEFSARIGTDREEARALLGRVSELYRELPRGAG